MKLYTAYMVAYRAGQAVRASGVDPDSGFASVVAQVMDTEPKDIVLAEHAAFDGYYAGVDGFDPFTPDQVDALYDY